MFELFILTAGAVAIALPAVFACWYFEEYQEQRKAGLFQEKAGISGAKNASRV